MSSDTMTLLARKLTQDPDVTMQEESEAMVLRRAQAGDLQALAMIYDRYQEPLYRYIFRQVGDAATAHDLTGDLFRRFLEALAREKGPDHHLQGWLYRAAHNLVVDYYRRQSHRQHLPLHSELIAGGDNPAARAETCLEAERARAALQLLTDEQRQVVTLKFLEGLSNEEIATIMEKPVGAVKALQHRGLCALRRHLAPMQKKVLP